MPTVRPNNRVIFYCIFITSVGWLDDWRQFEVGPAHVIQLGWHFKTVNNASLIPHI